MACLGSLLVFVACIKGRLDGSEVGSLEEEEPRCRAGYDGGNGSPPSRFVWLGRSFALLKLYCSIRQLFWGVGEDREKEQVRGLKCRIAKERLEWCRGVLSLGSTTPHAFGGFLIDVQS